MEIGLLSLLLLFLGPFGLLIYGLRKLLALGWGQVDRSDEESIRGRIVVVTGANAGVGRATSIEFAKRGGIVILACRTLEEAKSTLFYIRSRTFVGELVPMECDLSSLESIKDFYHQIVEKYDKIDILVNNAGVRIPCKEKRKTKDGFEIHFGVNYLAHFFLTSLLMPLLKNAGSSRIVNVSSYVIKNTRLNLSNLMLENDVKVNGSVFDNPLYNNSKLANALFSKELGRKLEGTGVRTYAVCPGIVNTRILRYERMSWWNKCGHYLVNLTFRTPREGCQTILHCALSRKCAQDSGLFYRNCTVWNDKFTLMEDLFVPGKMKPLLDVDALNLWRVSEEKLRMKFSL